MPLTDASESFRQHEILLTGANGFLGKVILGFFLDRFPEFKHLHILVRPRGGAPARERFDSEVLTSPSLAEIVAKRGRRFLDEKVTIHAGDIGDPGCGLPDDTIESLRGRIGLVINCAGLVEFFPPIDDSFKSNVDGVENVVALAKNLGAKLLHVSTCYVCGAADGLIEETDPVLGFYPRRKDPDDTSFNFRDEIAYCRERIRQMYEAAGLDPAQGARVRTKELAQRLIDFGTQRASHWGWVNIYTYAKSIGEQILAAEEGLEYAIVRPAIVEAALEFPFPGWVEGGRTAAPLVLMAMGGLRHWTVRGDIPLEVVPVDQVAASVLIVSALLLDGKARHVYQLGTADVNPLLMEPLVRLLHQQSRRVQREERRKARKLGMPRLPGGVRIISVAAAQERRIRLQRRLDRAQRMLSATRRLLKRAGLPGENALATAGMLVRALGLQAVVREQTLALYQPFILDNRFIFESENIRAARAMLSERDRKLLPWTPERIQWREYWIHHEIAGIRKWVEPEAFKHWNFQI